MPWFTTSPRPRRSPPLRARLFLEELGGRAVPSSLTQDSSDELILNPAYAPLAVTSPPQIVEFTAEEFDHGWYFFTGRVEANPSSAGLTVTFGGVSSLQGKVKTTNSDGTFSLLVAVQTDGSDNGTVTAQTTANGQQSNIAECDITPTP